MDFLFEIEEYLSGNRSFLQAVEIYAQYGENSALKTLFSLGEDSYSRKKLKEELRRILESRKIQKQEFEVYSKPKQKGSINVDALPPHLKTEYYKLAPLIREIAATNPTLVHLKTDKARYESAARIIELVDQRRAIFIRLDYFQEHGKDHPFYATPVPEQQTISHEMSYYEAQYKLKLARSLRSKLAKNPKRIADWEKTNIEIKHLEEIVNKNKPQ